ncbi:MAG: ribonuclease J [Ruminococcaceae bacterium]|nr:ribonuclease J [Oscillospiraceae bacterium]
MAKKEKDLGKLRIISLGGLNEVGKNITVIEHGNDIIIVDCGLGFPDEEMLGIDLVIPDITYLEKNQDRIRGLLLTHGHEDHIGAIPYILRTINPPIYGTKLTLGILRNKLAEHRLPHQPKLNVVSAGDVVKLGGLSAEFIRVNHSIADACCLAIRTPLGTLVHTGDFKLDISPIDGEMMDVTRLGEIGREGVLLLMCESTNAERHGFTPSERKVGESLEYIFTRNADKRLVIATFSSNVHRVQQIIDASANHGRKVAITGRSMLNVVGAAVELGYMKVPSGVLIDIADIRRYKPEELTIITTGSQGEPMSALYRMAWGEHDKVTLGRQDLVVLSSSAIPGNEKLVGRVINELSKNGVSVLHDSVVEVHVSGHACQEELKLMQALTKPKYFMPIHGEFRHLAANRELARYMGIEDRNIFISDIGRVLEIDQHGARFNGTVPSGKVLVDGYGVGDVGNIVLRDRRHLAQDGLIVVVATVDIDEGMILSGPDIISRGFVYVRESEELMDQARSLALDALTDCMDTGVVDRMEIKSKVKDDLSKFLYAKTKRKPMVLPVIMNV